MRFSRRIDAGDRQIVASDVAEVATLAVGPANRRSYAIDYDGVVHRQILLEIEAVSGRVLATASQGFVCSKLRCGHWPRSRLRVSLADDTNVWSRRGNRRR